MLICGIKMTHDAAIALLNDDELIGCVEIEKISNNPRHSHMIDFTYIEDVVRRFGYQLSDIDKFVIDGWKNTYSERSKHDNGSYLTYGNQVFEVAAYNNAICGTYEGIPFESKSSIQIGEKYIPYVSYSHMYTHLTTAYCTSPFARRGESCFISVFDGGCKPTLFYFDATKKEFVFCEEYINFGGHIYDSTAAMFKPYGDGKTIIPGRELIKKDIAGKVMAYIALGKVRDDYVDVFNDIYNKCKSIESNQENKFESNKVFDEMVLQHFIDVDESADVLASFHAFLEKLLVDNLHSAVKRSGFECKNLCMSGGCALNIKWNSAIREQNIFEEIFVPPFTNDSGSAIGCACAERIRLTQLYPINWNVYCGFPLNNDFEVNGWKIESCTIKQLAQILYSTQEPVVVLQGRAEAGPRALGGRSILCDARSEQSKTLLNKIKRREWYRPVAPICIEEKSTEYFIPGGSDKYMLFEHQANEYAHETIPAIIHLDGSARLQTVSKEDSETIYQILTEYEKLSGISVLCNTSANNLGSGFFPDVKSAQEWGRCKYIWSEGVLYTKIEEIIL